MLPFLRNLLPILFAFFLMAEFTSAWAGWMGFRNDTTKTLIVQETVATSTGSRQGQSQKLYANETVRDNSKRAGGKRTFTIYDSANPEKVVYTGQFAVPDESENILYVLKSDGRGGIAIETVRTTPMLKPKR